MTQRWVNLTFLHYALEPEVVQSQLPPGLTVDTFPDSDGREMAWIGLVPFEIQDLAFPGRVKIPTAHTFLETNVRTYVHGDGKDPGVWFFSLDAASPLACKAARIWYALPYWPARMSFDKNGDRLEYRCQRLKTPNPTSQVAIEVGEPISLPQLGQFEFFLVERYLLYSYRRGRLSIGRVHHKPYPLRSATLVNLEDNLCQAAGLPTAPIVSVLFSEGVDVDVFRPTRMS